MRDLLLGVTIGDAAGVGPQLVLQAWEELRSDGPICVYGDVRVLEAAAASLSTGPAGVRKRAIVQVAAPEHARDVPPEAIAVLDTLPGASMPTLDPYPWGQAVPVFGALQHAALCAAIDDAMAHRIDAIVTAPWHKKRLADAGLPPTGHTEVLAERAGGVDVIMLLAGPVLRVALATTHTPLHRVPTSLSTAALVDLGERLAHSLARDLNREDPRIGFCGLNPHAGEEGVLGHEDLAIIAPAVEELVARGVDAFGPVAADTLFPLVAHGRMHADAVVAMYHDQGLGPLKTWHFGNAANITLGLPFVRTSVDHGTAYDVAGTARVRHDSFVYAAMEARAIVARRDAFDRRA